MEDAEEQAIDNVTRLGIDRKTSRRIVREVVNTVFGRRSEALSVSDGDLHALDDLAHDIQCLVWKMDEEAEENSKTDQRQRLMGLSDKARGILEIVERYVLPATAPEKEID